MARHNAANPGTAGFAGAPVTKGMLSVLVGFSVLAMSLTPPHHTHGPYSQLSSVLGSLSVNYTGSLVAAVYLLYSMRPLERQMGPAKFGSLTLITSMMAMALQGLVSLFPHQSGTTSPALSVPYGMIFALLLQYTVLVPATTSVSVAGLKLNDKVLVYLTGLQLLLSGGWRTFMLGSAGFIAGLIYRSNVLGIRNWQIPRSICRLFQITLGRLFSDPPSPASHVFTHGSSRHAHRSGSNAGAGPTPSGSSQPEGLRHGGNLPPRPSAPPFAPSPEGMAALGAMGFDASRAAAALTATNNDLTAAVAMLV